MLHHTKRQFEKLISPICRIFIKCHISPNWITILGFCFTILCSVAYAFNHYIPAIILKAIGGILDGIDGKVARDIGAQTKFGGFLDSTVDRLSEVAIGIGILLSFRNHNTFMLASILVFFAITGSLLTSYVRARGQGIGCDPKEGLLQRADRGVILALPALIGWSIDHYYNIHHHYVYICLLVGVAIVATASYITVFQRIYFVWKGTKK